MRTERNIKEELKKLEDCCRWNGWNTKSTPAYKHLIKELKSLSKKETQGGISGGSIDSNRKIKTTTTSSHNTRKQKGGKE